MIKGSVFKLPLLLLASFLISCNVAMLYRENKFENGVLKPAQHDSLKKLLSLNTLINLRDTIIMKYDFNNDDCWQFLDKQNASYISKVLFGYQNKIRETSIERPEVSIYQYREAGRNLSKYKKHNNDIVIDNGYIRKLFFKKRATCGSSVIILPSGKFVLLKSDSHFGAINLSSAEIEKIINR